MKERLIKVECGKCGNVQTKKLGDKYVCSKCKNGGWYRML